MLMTFAGIPRRPHSRPRLTLMLSANARLFVVLLAGILVGGAFAFLFGADGAEANSLGDGLLPDALSPAQTLQVSGQELPAVEARAGQQSVQQVSSAAEVATVTVEAKANSRAAVADNSPIESGQGALFGTVRDEDGHPLQDVHLRLIWSKSTWRGVAASSLGGEAPAYRSLEETLREAQQNYQDRAQLRREATTDSTGAYRFDDLPDRRWSLTAFKPGYLVQRVDRPGSIENNTQVDFTGKPVVDVIVNVLGTDGQPMDSAMIQCALVLDAYKRVSFRWSPEENLLRLAPGEYTVTAYGPDTHSSKTAQVLSEPHTIQVTNEQPPAPFTLTLQTQLEIRGRFVFSDSDPQPKYSYAPWMKLNPGEAPDLIRLANVRDREFWRPGSEFHVRNLAPGRYVVGALRGTSGPIVAHQIIDLESSSVRCDLEIPELDLSRSILVTGAGPDGQTVDHFQCNLTRTGTSGNRYIKLNQVALASGGVLLQLSENDAMEYFSSDQSEQEYILDISNSKFGNRLITLTRGQTEVFISYAAAATLTVQIADYAGRSFTNRLRVRAIPTSNPDALKTTHVRESVQVGANGMQTIESLEPGNYMLYLQALPDGASTSHWYHATIIDTTEASLSEGENKVTLRLPNNVQQQVHWSAAKPGAQGTLYPTDWDKKSPRSYTAFFNKDQVATFNFLEPGAYRFHVSEGSDSILMMTVPSGLLEFDPK